MGIEPKPFYLSMINSVLRELKDSDPSGVELWISKPRNTGTKYRWIIHRGSRAWRLLVQHAVG